jgi:hypothetical protein
MTDAPHSGTLETIAHLLTSGRTTAEALDWGAFRYQRTAAIRSVLASRDAPGLANKLLAALRGVLRKAWRLWYVDVEAYQRPADLPSVRDERLLRRRVLTAGGELRALSQRCQADHSPVDCGLRHA